MEAPLPARKFRVSLEEGAPRVSAVHLTLLAHRALVHILQQLHYRDGYPVPHTAARPPPPAVTSMEMKAASAAGPQPASAGSPLAGEPKSGGGAYGVGAEPAVPAPLQVFANAHFPFTMYACALGLLAAAGVPGSDGRGPGYVAVAPAPAVDSPWTGVGEVRDVYVPVCRALARSWKLAELYGKMIEKLLERADRYCATGAMTPTAAAAGGVGTCSN
ncbi:hypothetical protein HK405_015395, partial [Cladochytrium tenue]